MESRFFTPVLTGPGAHSASCTVGTGSFPGVKSGLGVTLTPHPLLVPWSRKSRAIPLLPLWAIWPVQSFSACTTVHFTFTYTSTPPMDCTACTEPQCLYNGALYLYTSQCRKKKKKSCITSYFTTLLNHGSKHKGEALPKNYKFANQLQLPIPSNRHLLPKRNIRIFHPLLIAQNVLATKVHARIQNLE